MNSKVCEATGHAQTCFQSNINPVLTSFAFQKPDVAGN